MKRALAVLVLVGLAGCGNDYGTNPGGTTTLSITDVVVGTGATAAVGDTITVNYVGAYTNGNVFDSNQAVSFRLASGALIEGWVQGVPGMKVGGVRHLVVPPSLGYGSQGSGNIPPNTTLVFDIQLVAIAGK